MQSLSQEVVLRNPEQFKIAALNSVVSLFPHGHNPLFGGFGNRANDAFAYREAGVAPERIFIVNSKSEVIVATKTFRCTYPSLNNMVDHIFPPSVTMRKRQNTASADATSDQWNSFRFWKQSTGVIDVDTALGEYEASKTPAAISEEPSDDDDVVAAAAALELG